MELKKFITLTLILSGLVIIDAARLLYQGSIHTLAGHGNVKRMAALLKHGADVNAKSEYRGYTPLIVAADAGQSEMVAFLLSHGAEVNAENEYKWGALQCATRKGYVEIVKLLAEHGADLNTEFTNGSTPVQQAIYKGHHDLLLMLLEHGANPNKPTYGGDTPLKIAREMEDKNAIEILQTFKAQETTSTTQKSEAPKPVNIFDLMKLKK